MHSKDEALGNEDLIKNHKIISHHYYLTDTKYKYKNYIDIRTVIIFAKSFTSSNDV